MNFQKIFARLQAVFLVLTTAFVLVAPTEAATGDPVLINEVLASHTGTDNTEFIELFGTPGTSLAGLSLIVVESDSGSSQGTIDRQLDFGSADVLGSNGFFLVGNPSGLASNYGVTPNLAINNDFLENSSLTVALVDTGSISGSSVTGSEVVLDAVGLIDTGVGDLIFFSGPVVGPDGTFFPAGARRVTDGVDTDTAADWVISDFSLGPANTPTAGVVAPPPAALPLVINEIDYDQPGTDTAEFVEIRNNGPTTADLTGYTLELVNGSGGGAVVYATIDLAGFTLAAGDYFVVCANAATVANCDLDVSPDTNLVQNGAPDAVGLRFNGNLIDAVSYEGDAGAPYTEGSGAGLEDSGDGGISRCSDGTDTDQNNVDLVFTGITPGVANNCAPPPPVEACGDSFTPIYTVQGSGAASPLAGNNVAIEGIVVGDFQNNGSADNGDLNGFHVQDPAGDGDPATSDGIFVYAPGGMDVAVGDKVRVRGSVSEFNGLTEITASQIWQCSTGNSVAPTVVSLPVTTLDDFERYEGMLVTFPQQLYISEYFNFDRFGEIVLTSERQFQPTATYDPGSPAAAALAAANALSRITLDDGRTSQNPDPAIHPNGSVFDLTNRFRGGDTVQNVTGVLDYSFSLYRVQPTQGASYTPANPRPAQPADVGGNLAVASFNVLNYFTTLDNSGPICGPLANQDCRGADNATEFTRQRDKIIAALAEINADVVGLIEIENHPADVPTADLVSGLNAAVGAGAYDYIATGAIGSDAIRVALIYKPASVTPVGAYAVLDSSVDPRFLDDYNRPVLAQSFQDNASGGIFTVAVNHLKSKGSDCNAVGDPDLGDGAGNCNLTRKAAAEALVDWLAADPTGSGDADFLIIGDLNSYDKEDPIDAILAGSDDTLDTEDDYTDLIYQYLGEFAYSYVFDGQLGYLDHALANEALRDAVTGATVWHINADEPDLIDYDTSFKQDAQDALYEPNAYRSSDHDPVVVGLDVCDEIAPALEVTLSPDILWPANHKYVDVTATVVASDNFDPNPTLELVSITSNEPDDGLGDGDTANDIVTVDDYNFQLRAERSGTGEGRIYTITYRATDSCGNSTEASAIVTVPRDQGNSNGKDKSEPAEAVVENSGNEDAAGGEVPGESSEEAENENNDENSDEPQEAGEEAGDGTESSAEDEPGEASQDHPADNGNGNGQGNGNGPGKNK